MIKHGNPLLICDRCGKEEFLDDVWLDAPKIEFVSKESVYKCATRKRGEVCADCYKDFLELAENFFDEVNKNDIQ